MGKHPLHFPAQFLIAAARTFQPCSAPAGFAYERFVEQVLDFLPAFRSHFFGLYHSTRTRSEGGRNHKMHTEAQERSVFLVPPCASCGSFPFFLSVPVSIHSVDAGSNLWRSPRIQIKFRPIL